MTKISANLKQFFCEGKLFVNGDFLTSKELEEEKFKQLFSPINHQSYHFDVNSNVGTVSVEELDFIYEEYVLFYKNKVCLQSKNRSILI